MNNVWKQDTFVLIFFGLYSEQVLDVKLSKQGLILVHIFPQIAHKLEVPLSVRKQFAPNLFFLALQLFIIIGKNFVLDILQEFKNLLVRQVVNHRVSVLLVGVGSLRAV